MEPHPKKRRKHLSSARDVANIVSTDSIHHQGDPSRSPSPPPPLPTAAQWSQFSPPAFPYVYTPVVAVDDTKALTVNFVEEKYALELFEWSPSGAIEDTCIQPVAEIGPSSALPDGICYALRSSSGSYVLISHSRRVFSYRDGILSEENVGLERLANGSPTTHPFWLFSHTGTGAETLKAARCWSLCSHDMKHDKCLKCASE